jgi:Leucine Rich Repeat (LRR) protein
MDDQTEFTKLCEELRQLTKDAEDSSFDIESSPPESIYWKNELNLSKNGLTAVPAGIGQLVNLRILNLRNNQLTELSHEIYKLENLRDRCKVEVPTVPSIRLDHQIRWTSLTINI